MQEKDYLNWILGRYFMQAMNVALDMKGKTKYFEKPLLSMPVEDEELSEEERTKRDLQKEILKMNQWIANDSARGLPETKIL